MSQALEAWMVQTFQADATIASSVGKDSTNMPAVFPYHQRDADERVPYPHITIARFGDITERGIFQDQPDYSLRMDCPRIAICVWSTVNLDQAYPIFNRCDAILRGNVSSQYFSAYKVRRTHLRDDLFDQQAKAYHIHSEWSIWLQVPATV